MPNHNHNTYRKDFLKELFDGSFEFNLLFAPILKELGLTSLISDKQKLNVAKIIGHWLVTVQYIMIGRSEEEKEDIAARAIQKLMSTLQTLYFNLYGEDWLFGSAEYWKKIQAQFESALPLTFDEKLVARYLEDMCLMSMLAKDCSSFHIGQFGTRIQNVGVSLKMSTKDMGLPILNIIQSFNNIGQKFWSLTDHSFSLRKILPSVVMGGAAIFAGFPGLGMMLGFAGLTYNACSNLQLNTKLRGAILRHGMHELKAAGITYRKKNFPDQDIINKVLVGDCLKLYGACAWKQTQDGASELVIDPDYADNTFVLVKQQKKVPVAVNPTTLSLKRFLTVTDKNPQLLLAPANDAEVKDNNTESQLTSIEKVAQIIEPPKRRHKL